MKKYFRIINKLIQNHGYNKKVLQYVFMMNEHIIKRHTQSGGFESVETLTKLQKIGINTLKYVLENEIYGQEHIKELKKINEFLTEILPDDLEQEGKQ